MAIINDPLSNICLFYSGNWEQNWLLWMIVVNVHYMWALLVSTRRTKCLKFTQWTPEMSVPRRSVIHGTGKRAPHGRYVEISRRAEIWCWAQISCWVQSGPIVWVRIPKRTTLVKSMELGYTGPGSWCNLGTASSPSPLRSWQEFYSRLPSAQGFLERNFVTLGSLHTGLLIYMYIFTNHTFQQRKDRQL